VNNLGVRFFRFSHFESVSVHIQYTSNMAARYGNYTTDVTSPHRKPMTWVQSRPNA